MPNLKRICVFTSSSPGACSAYLEAVRALGRTLLRMRLVRLEAVRKPTGEALLAVLQLVPRGKPLVSDAAASLVERRTGEKMLAPEPPMYYGIARRPSCSPKESSHAFHTGAYDKEKA